jgi:hypothetical protein
MSSLLPEDQITYENWRKKLNIEKNSRSFIYNADHESLFSALDFWLGERGTRVSRAGDF